MKLNEALKLLRGELGLSQSELANLLHINFSTVSRWENNRATPNRSTAIALLDFAREQGVSENTTRSLKNSLLRNQKETLNVECSELLKLEHSNLCNIIEEATFPLYVTDYESDAIIYMNKEAEKLFGYSLATFKGKACYECIMNSHSQCEFCRKNELSYKEFTPIDANLKNGGKFFRILAKKVTWNGKKAVIHYVTGQKTSIQNQQKLQSLIDKLPAGIGIFEIYLSGEVVLSYLNDGYYSLIGSTREVREKYYDKNVLNAICDEDVVELKQSLANSAKNHKKIYVETRIKMEDGTFKWFNIQGNLIEFNEQKCVYYSVFSDVDLLKKTQIKIELERKQKDENSFLLDSIMKNFPGAVTSFDVLDDKITMSYISEGCKKITGFTADETIDRLKDGSLMDVHPDDMAILHKIAVNSAKNKQSFSHTFRVMTKSGRYKWVNLNLSPVFHPDRLSYYGVYLDVTEQEETKQLQSKLIDFLPGGVVIYRISDTIETVYFSDGILRLSGHTADEYKSLVKDDPIGAIVYDEDRQQMKEKIANASSVGESLSSSFRIITKNGNIVWIQLNARMISENKDGRVYYAVLTRPSEEAEIYQNVVNESNTAIFIAERDTRRLVFVNNAFKNMLTIKQDESVVGKPLPNVITSSNIVFSDEELNSLSSEEYTQKYITTVSGKRLQVLGKRIDWNGCDAYLCYVIDQTELLNSREQLQNLIDLVPCGIAIYQVDGSSIALDYINQAYHRMLGGTNKNRSQFLGENTIDAVHKDDVQIIYESLNRMQNGADTDDIHFRVQDNDGNYMWVRLLMSVIKRVGKKLTIYGSYSDFEYIMKAQQDLQSNKAMLYVALESTKTLAWKYDYRINTITDSGSLGEKYNLPRVVPNIPDCLIEAGFIHKDSVDDFIDLFKRISSEKTVQADVLAMSNDKKDYVWDRLIYTPVFDEDGNYIESIGTSIEVTEQKEKEQNYEEQLRLKQLLENDAIAVVHYNLSKNLVTDTQSQSLKLLEIMHKKTADEVLAAIADNTQSKEKELFKPIKNHKSLMKMYHNGKTQFAVRHHLKFDDKWYETNISMIENPYTSDIEALSVLRDITETVRAEKIINTLVDIDYDTIMTINPHTGVSTLFDNKQVDAFGVVISKNLPFINVNGGAEEFFEKYCADADVKRVIQENSIETIVKKLEEFPLYTTIYSVNIEGKIFHKRVIFSYLEENKSSLLCAIQDITKTHELEEKQKGELEKALANAKNANQAKTDFFSRMSHDMRTPMNGILGLAGLAEEENDVEELKNSMTKIRESGTYLLSLINDTLDFQRIESGKLKIEKQIVSTKILIESIVDLIGQAAKAKNIDFKVINKNAETNWYVRLDPLRTKQIFINLLSNAVKFTPNGGAVSFEFEMLSREGMISHNLIKISDTGLGMSKDFLENHIFKPFSQEYNDVSSQYAGSGLGLSIVHSLVEMMGGRIEVESEIGVGTTFYVHLDFERVNESEVSRLEKRNESKESIAKNILKGKNVLLVEDHPLNAEIAKKVLKNVGCTVVWENNGKKGFERFSTSKKNEFDLILMDIRMPIMNGLESASAIRALAREDAKSVPIIAMTANAYDEDVKKSIEAGMNSHLAKPILPQKLFEEMARQIEIEI